MTPYIKKDFTSLLGTPGFSDELLQNHFTLYEGYVNNTNTLVELLHSKEFSTPEYAELQRRLGWEWNGMRLHELYFENLMKEDSDGPTEKAKEKIEKAYGSIENWQKNFENLGTMRGIGWVALVHDTETDELLNIWINEHDLGILAETKILLIMDVFEHAFMIDYGIKRPDYIKNFFAHIDWNIVNKRLAK